MTVTIHHLPVPAPKPATAQTAQTLAEIGYLPEDAPLFTPDPEQADALARLMKDPAWRAMYREEAALISAAAVLEASR
jgi:hypothetical protein